MNRTFTYYYYWRYAAKLPQVDQSLNAKVAEEIKNKLIRKYPSQLVDPKEELPIDIIFQERELEFFAKLEQGSGFNTNTDFTIIARYKSSSNNNKDTSGMTTSEFISEEIEFTPPPDQLGYSPQKLDTSQTRTMEKVQEFNNLVIPDKNEIASELINFLAPVNKTESWSRQNYNSIVPLVHYLIKSQSSVFVFAGDPGTGKTVLAKSLGAVVSQKLRVPVKLWSIGINVRGIGRQGLASTMVFELFNHAKSFVQQNNNQPLLILFDESETIVGSRKNAGNGAGADENIAIVNAIIKGIDDIKEAKYKVAFIFISNILERLDEALMRRCSFYMFSRPDSDSRKQIFANFLEKTGFTEKDIKTFADATEPKLKYEKKFPYTGSDIETILSKAVKICINKNKPLDTQTILDVCEKTYPTGYTESL
jgi:SpoVK/Ycf46/Vps4 family AAA+-type ATPase